MPAFEGITSAQVSQQAVIALGALRLALADCQNKNAWLSGLSVADLQAIGFSAADAATLKSAFADAGALYQLYGRGDPSTDGALPQGYSLPYVFGASQRAVLGPM